MDIYISMKKVTLREELKKIHSITYGKQKLNENFIDDILNKFNGSKIKVDDPKKADFVSSNVTDFFNSLENASVKGLEQQSSGNMNYQKEVESMQIGLMLLGYDLPKYGVDGLFGPETASSVSKFISDKINNQVSESQMTQLSSFKSSTISTDNDNTKYDSVNKNLMDDIEKASKLSGVKVKITTAVSGHSEKVKHKNTISRHMSGDAVDISIINDKPVSKNITDTNKFVNALKSLGYTVNVESGNQKAVLTYGFPGHDDHIHISNKENVKNKPAIVATPEMLKKLIDLLKQKGVTSDDLKKYIDPTQSSVEFTDINLNSDEGFKKYSEICQKFIDIKKPNPLGISGYMMAKAAKNTFIKYGKFVPAELALSQLVIEGGIGNGDLKSRPIRTKNPFNIGNVDSGSNKYESSVENGIQTYYDLIGRNYLGKGKTANDLIKNFVNKDDNRYASNVNYEKELGQTISQINKITRTV